MKKILSIFLFLSLFPLYSFSEYVKIIAICEMFDAECTYPLGNEECSPLVLENVSNTLINVIVNDDNTFSIMEGWGSEKVVFFSSEEERITRTKDKLVLMEMDLFKIFNTKKNEKKEELFSSNSIFIIDNFFYYPFAIEKDGGATAFTHTRLLKSGAQVVYSGLCTVNSRDEIKKIAMMFMTEDKLKFLDIANEDKKNIEEIIIEKKDALSIKELPQIEQDINNIIFDYIKTNMEYNNLTPYSNK
ncbi:MAG: hypothetical protein ACK5LE_04910 [Alphaproteobacteria bacterium]